MNVSHRIPWATSIATSLLRTNGPSGPCFILAPDLVAWIKWDHHTLEQLMSDQLPRTQSVGVVSQILSHPFTRLVIVDSNITHMNLIKRRWERATVRCLTLPGPSCSMVSSPPGGKGPNGRGYDRHLGARRRLNVLCLHRSRVDAACLGCR